MTKLYIAYGSNMDEEQMAFRCPTAKLLGKSEVKDYQLMFKGSLTGAYATIEPNEGSTVPVLIWEIEKADEARLDRYEGYPTFYYKKNLLIELSGKTETAMVYIMDERRRLGEPSSHYYDVLETAYRKFGFDMKILIEAYEYSKPKGMLPGGWKIGDTCVMITNKRKGYTSQYKIDGFDGSYFELRDKSQNLHRVSIGRMFHSREEALATLDWRC